MPEEYYGDHSYYFPQDGAVVKVPYEVRFSQDSEGPAEEATTSQARVYRHNESSDANLLQTIELERVGTHELDLDISGFSPADDSPLLIEFFFEKEHTAEGPKQGTTESQTTPIVMALATPAVGELTADPRVLRTGEASQITVSRWAALTYDTPGTARLDLGNGQPVDAARFPSDYASQVAWTRKVGATGSSEDAGTGEEQSHTWAEEDNGNAVIFTAALGEQPEPPTANVLGSAICLRLLYNDPTDPEATRLLPFPADLPLKVIYDDGEELDATLAEDGLLTAELDRTKRRFTLKLPNPDGNYVGHNPAESPPNQLVPAGDVDTKIGEGWRVFLLPAELTLATADTTVEVEGGEAPWDARKAEFTGLNDSEQTFGTVDEPVRVKLNPHWLFARFVYYDRWLEADRLTSVPVAHDGDLKPIVISGWNDGRNADPAAPDTRCFWPILPEDATDDLDAVQVIPWWTQRELRRRRVRPLARPYRRSLLQFGWEEEHPFIHTQDDGTRSVIDLSDEGIRETPGAERLRYYDLPKVWKSRGYYGHISDARGKHGRFEAIAGEETTLAEPMVFSLDDIVLTNEELTPLSRRGSRREGLRWDRRWGISIFHHSFAAVAGSAGSTGRERDPQPRSPDGSRTCGPNGLYNPDTGRNLGYFSAVQAQNNYLADYPHWTRLVVAGGNHYSVFDQRLPDADEGVVGARAGVRLLDATAKFEGITMYDDATGNVRSDGLPSAARKFGVAGGSDRGHKRPDRSDGTFFSIQPYYSQRYADRSVPFDGTKDSFLIGRYDMALLRCCGREGDVEKAVNLHLFRYSYQFSGNPTGTSRPAFIQATIQNVANRWNGDEPGGAPARARLLPQADERLEIQVVWAGQSLPRAIAQFQVKVKNKDRDWMDGIWGTGEWNRNRHIVQADLTVAHEAGHGDNLPDEYNERWSAASLGLISWQWNTPGDPYRLDKATNAAAMMHGEIELRNRYFWPSAEWCRRITNIPLQVSYGGYSYKLPAHSEDPRTWAWWPAANAIDWEAAAGTDRGRCDLYLYPLGQDKYGQAVLPNGPYDGLLIVAVRVKCSGLPRGITAALQARNANASSLPAWRRTRFSRQLILAALASQVHSDMNNSYFAAGTLDVNGTSVQLRRCAIRFELRFLDTDARRANKPGTDANTARDSARNLARDMGHQFELEFVESNADDDANIQWEANPYKPRPMNKVSFEISTLDGDRGGEARSPELLAVDTRVEEYETADHGSLDTETEALDAIVTACDAWLAANGSPAAGSPAAVVKPEVEALKTTCNEHKDYLQRARTSRKAKLFYANLQDLRDAMTDYFPSMCGLPNIGAMGILPENLETLVRQVIPGASVESAV